MGSSILTFRARQDANALETSSEARWRDWPWTFFDELFHFYLNYYYFVEEEVINDKTYPFKVFSDKRLDQIAIELCSINKINDKKTEIYEYGCEVDLSLDFNDSRIYFCKNFT